ncbi:MAG: peptidoglycan bridge formation glycyltransferase FemA/FemB family protein [Bacteroidales bacterium]|nr:peptidoglycan bridge formation glycyltransferase FemA/FemB family protein [Bacteroidales bacterium]
MKLIKSLKELNINAKDFPIFFWDEWLAFEKNSICDVFLFFDEESKAVIPFKVHTLKFLKKADYIYVPLNIEGKNLKSNSEKLVIERFHAFLKNNKICDVIFPPQHFIIFQTYPSKCLYYEIGTLTVDLTIPENELFNLVNSENRRQIRKSKKLNTLVQFGQENLETFYKTYKSTGKKKGISIEPISYFEAISSYLNKNYLIGVCKNDSSVFAGVFDIFDYTAAYSFYSGTTDNIFIKGAKKHLIWDEFMLLKSKGLKKYHFGGFRLNLNIENDLYNVQVFKQQMAAKITKGYHFIKVINPLRYYLFAFALKVKSLIVGKDLGFINKSGLEIKKSK